MARSPKRQMAVRSADPRGKAHRRIRPEKRGWPYDPGSVACGAPMRWLLQTVPVEQTAPEDRCKHCWRGTEWEA